MAGTVEGCTVIADPMQLEKSTTRKKHTPLLWAGGRIRPKCKSVRHCTSSLNRDLERSGLVRSTVDAVFWWHLADGVHSDRVASAGELRLERDLLVFGLWRKIKVLVSERERFAEFIHGNDDHREIVDI